MKKISILALSTLFSASALANNIIYSCKTAENQTLTVTKEGKNYAFSYGNIKFKNPINQVMQQPMTEIAGGSQFTTITIAMQNADKIYVIGHIEPNGNPKELFEAGLSVENAKSGEKIQYFECKNPVRHNFDRKLMRKSGFAA
ncbi:hypothetical protein [Mannheimia haemolytica]|uniref:hypothetical protein n=1 Tax=Mannheimia haemolytica TaxID=75985 RepID=UPI0039FCA095